MIPTSQTCARAADPRGELGGGARRDSSPVTGCRRRRTRNRRLGVPVANVCVCTYLLLLRCVIPPTTTAFRNRLAVGSDVRRRVWEAKKKIFKILNNRKIAFGVRFVFIFLFLCRLCLHKCTTPLVFLFFILISRSTCASVIYRRVLVAVQN